jgi:hypothetical protein
MHEIIDVLLNQPEFKISPPVLIDIGASGNLPSDWETIASHSICIAFDADSRDFGYIEKKSSLYRKLYVYNAVVIDTPVKSTKFYLTESPHCSSALEPDNESLKVWDFAPLFKIRNEVELNAVTFPDIFKEIGIQKVDWFKTDSQGMDLRLFRSMGEQVTKNVLAADFEPGIIDAYHEEDKLYALLQAMQSMPFWVNEMNVRGDFRFDGTIKSDYFPGIDAEYLQEVIPTSPGWVQIGFLNKMEAESKPSKRDYLLAICFALIKKQAGFALKLCKEANLQYEDAIFDSAFDKIISLVKKDIKKAKNKRRKKNFIRLSAKKLGLKL